MKRLRTLSLVAALALAAVAASAQTPTQKLAFDVPDTVAATASVTYSVKMNAGVDTVEKVTCTAGSVTYPAGSTCTAPLPVAVAKGDVIIVTATNAGGSASSAPFTDPGTPGLPAGIKIVIVITVP